MVLYYGVMATTQDYKNKVQLQRKGSVADKIVKLMINNDISLDDISVHLKTKYLTPGQQLQKKRRNKVLKESREEYLERARKAKADKRSNLLNKVKTDEDKVTDLVDSVDQPKVQLKPKVVIGGEE